MPGSSALELLVDWVRLPVIRVAAAPTVFRPLIEGTATIGALFTADVIGSEWPPRMANRVGWLHP